MKFLSSFLAVSVAQEAYNYVYDSDYQYDYDKDLGRKRTQAEKDAIKAAKQGLEILRYMISDHIVNFYKFHKNKK